MGHEHSGRGKAQRTGLRLGAFHELCGGDEDAHDAAGLEIVDVVHTARRATPSIGEGLNDNVALRGDLVAEVDRGGLSEGRLLEAPHVDTRGTEPFVDAVEEDVSPRL